MLYRTPGRTRRSGVKRKRNCVRRNVGEQQYLYLIWWVVGCRLQSTYEQPEEKISGRQGVASEANQVREVTTGRIKRDGKEDKNSLILRRHQTGPERRRGLKGIEDGGKEKQERKEALGVSGLWRRCGVAVTRSG